MSPSDTTKANDNTTKSRSQGQKTLKVNEENMALGNSSGTNKDQGKAMGLALSTNPSKAPASLTLQVPQPSFPPNYRPVGSSNLEIYKTVNLSGIRPIASNDIDDPESLMGYLD